MRRSCIAFAFCLVTFGVGAQPQLPHIAESADNYRKSIEGRTVGADVRGLLTGIQRARANRRHGELILLYEQLVRLNTDNSNTWLQLGISWRENEPLADNGLSSAYIAYRTARTPSDQIESLLLMSWFLRTRLEQYRKSYEAARESLRQAEASHSRLTKPAPGEEGLQLDRKDPVGSINLLEQTRDSATSELDQSMQQIGFVTAALDEIYRDLATKLPVLDADRLKATDARSAIFGPVHASGSKIPRVSYRFDNNEVRSCIDFNQELDSSGLAYNQFVGVIDTNSNSQASVGITTSGSSLCITGLSPGKGYEVTLRQGLRSKQGATLSAPIIAEVIAPDRPRMVAFTGSRHFILPTSGPGLVPFSATNVDKFDLQIIRITDRMLHRQIALNYIGGKLPNRELDEIRNRFAETLWAGTAELSQAKRNEPAKSYLPVRKILDDRQDWVLRVIAGAKPNQNRSPTYRENSEPSQPVVLQGEFFAGPPSFEDATMKVANPGVYGLITRDLSRDRECDDNCDYSVQWFLNTDIGLTYYEGENEFTVVARSLRTGSAKVDARIELVSAGNRVLDSGTTDENGVAKLRRSLTRGDQSNALVAVLAHHEADFSFMTYGPERLVLSRLNVDGRQLTRGYSAFMTTDRGLYEPGETINVLAIIRDSQGRAPDSPPTVNVRLEARDQTPVPHPIRAQEWKLGGTMVSLRVPKLVRPGAARITMSLGSDGDDAVIGDATIHIGPVRPDRARLDFVDWQKGWHVRKTDSGSISIEGTIAAQYLHYSKKDTEGAARDLKVEALVRVAPSDRPAHGCYEGFTFGRFDDKPIPLSARHFIRYTDQAGRHDLKLAGIPYPGDTTKPLSSTIEVTLFDSAGPLASRSKVFPVTDDRGWIGISKFPRLRPGSKAGTFSLDVEVVSILGDNKPDSDRRFEFSIEQEKDTYVWERRDNTWQHVRTSTPEPIAKGGIVSAGLTRVPTGTAANNCVAAFQTRNIATDLEVGRFVLTVTDPQTGRTSSVRFNTGTTATDAEQLEPNIFALSADKPDNQPYRSGDTIVLTAQVPFDGEVLVAFADADVLAFKSGQVRNGIARIPYEIPTEWQGKGLYALATAFRSDTKGTFHAAPTRAIGAIHFRVSGDETGYGVAIRKLDAAADDRLYPNDTLSFEVCIKDPSGACSTKPPADAFAVAFVVDEGLLSLTGHHDPDAPDPERYFHGRQKLGVNIMDNYGRLLLKEGGDRPGRLALSNYTSVRIVSVPLGPEALKDGRATFKVPKLELQNGSASIYVVVWSKDYVARQTDSVAVRNRVIADLDAPRFLLASDRAILPLRLENIDWAHESEYVVRVTASGAVNGIALIGDDGKTPPAQPNIEFRIPLPRNQQRTRYLAVEVPPDRTGRATLSVSLESPDPPLPAHRYEWTFNLRPPALPSVETISFPLGPKGTHLGSLLEGVIAGSYDDDALITARYSDSPQALLSSYVGTRSDFTPSTVEHLIWRGLLLLYGTNRADSADQKSEIARILTEVQSLQLPNGSFVPYRTVGDYSDKEHEVIASVLPTASALDLLMFARNAGHDVSDRAIRSARSLVISRLTTRDPDSRSSSTKCTFDLESAYAWLVLIESGHVDHTRLPSLDTCEYDDPTAQAAAAAAVAKYGRSDQAKLMLASFAKSNSLSDLESLPDVRLAMMLTFLTEAGASTELLDTVADSLLTRIKDAPLSAAALAWVVRAMSNPKQVVGSRLTPADLDVQGVALGSIQVGRNGVLESKPMGYGALRRSKISAAVKGGKRARGFVTIEGLLRNPVDSRRVPPNSLKRRFFDIETGNEIDLQKNPVEVGQRLVVVVEGDAEALPPPSEPDSAPVLLVDLLPSAFQVVSTNVFGDQAVPLLGASRQLVPRGLLRSVQTESDRWVALIVPESRRSRPTRQDGDQPPANQQNGGPSPKPQDDDDPANGPAKGDTADVEFRQGYVVRVNMAGTFTYPAMSIEASRPPTTTQWAEQTQLQVRRPEPRR